MPASYTGGLNFTWPLKGETNWDGTVDTALTKISAHNHTGGGLGVQLTSSAFASDALNGTVFRLANAQYLRARNAAGSADVNLLRLDASDLLDIARVARLSSTETLVASGAVSVTTSLTILNGASLAMTLANGAEGQLKFIVNIAATVATVTPATTSGANTVSLQQYGFVAYIYLSGEWRVLRATKAVVTDDIQATTATSGTYDVVASVFTFNNAGATTATFNAGAAGQEVDVYNIGAGTVTLTLTGRPAATDVATIVTGGFCRLVMINSLWQPYVGVGCTLA